jgi:hypothetical protein
MTKPQSNPQYENFYSIAEKFGLTQTATLCTTTSAQRVTQRSNRTRAMN